IVPILRRARWLRKGKKALMALLAAMTVASCAPRESEALRFSTWGSLDEIATLKPLLAEFERQNPDIRVELIHIPDAYPHKVRLMAASGKMPDVLFMESQTMPGF